MLATIVAEGVENGSGPVHEGAVAGPAKVAVCSGHHHALVVGDTARGWKEDLVRHILQ